MSGQRSSFTLLELIIVMVIVAILAVISFPRFTTMKESSYNQEAIATLKILQDAEKYYKMETGSFYPSTGTETNIPSINSNLSLNLPTGSTRAWNYTVDDAGCVDATRYSGSTTWHMEIEDDEVKSGGC